MGCVNGGAPDNAEQNGLRQQIWHFHKHLGYSKRNFAVVPSRPFSVCAHTYRGLSRSHAKPEGKFKLMMAAGQPK